SPPSTAAAPASRAASPRGRRRRRRRRWWRARSRGRPALRRRRGWAGGAPHARRPTSPRSSPLRPSWSSRQGCGRSSGAAMSGTPAIGCSRTWPWTRVATSAAPARWPTPCATHERTSRRHRWRLYQRMPHACHSVSVSKCRAPSRCSSQHPRPPSGICGYRNWPVWRRRLRP
ncbi:unnamed protein product, partial [Prorocentrum cordatum]